MISLKGANIFVFPIKLWRKWNNEIKFSRQSSLSIKSKNLHFFPLEIFILTREHETFKGLKFDIFSQLQWLIKLRIISKRKSRDWRHVTSDDRIRRKLLFGIDFNTSRIQMSVMNFWSYKQCILSRSAKFSFSLKHLDICKYCSTYLGWDHHSWDRAFSSKRNSSVILVLRFKGHELVTKKKCLRYTVCEQPNTFTTKYKEFILNVNKSVLRLCLYYFLLSWKRKQTNKSIVITRFLLLLQAIISL